MPLPTVETLEKVTLLYFEVGNLAYVILNNGLVQSVQPKRHLIPVT